MTHRRGVPFAVLALLLLNEVFDAFAQFCFKKTASSQGTPSITDLNSAYAFVLGTVGQGYLWLGVGAIAFVFISWIVVLSKIDLSVAVPLTSISYVFVALVSLIFLHEQVSAVRWAGIAFILLGVTVVSRSSESEEAGRS